MSAAPHCIPRCIFFGLSLVTSCVFAQSSSTGPANAWLRTPTPSPLATDGADKSVRMARDQYFDSLFGVPSPLTARIASSVHVAHDTAAPDITKIPEIPQNPDRAILTGTFATFQSILSQSQRSLYTELLISVDRVFADPTGQLAAGRNISVAIPGGTVQTATDTLSFLVDPEDFFIQPQKRYLLVLSYHSDGGFYTLSKDWEISDGMLNPNSKIEQLRATKRKAALANLPDTELPAAIAGLLSRSQ